MCEDGNDGSHENEVIFIFQIDSIKTNPERQWTPISEKEKYAYPYHLSQSSLTMPWCHRSHLDPAIGPFCQPVIVVM